ncbi:MAG: hypothetical protein ABI821_00060 [Pseudomonadota bacterium]
MNSSSYCQGRRRLRAAAGFMLMFASLAGNVQAAEFDQKLSAPLMKDAGTLRTQAQSYSTRFVALQGAGPEQLITNRALASERFDLAWQIQQSIDVHRPLGDLSAVGFVDRGDGSFSIDLEKFPQWDRLDQALSGLLPQLEWEAYSRELINRGMARNEAVKMGAYVASHNVRAAVGAKTLPISLGFSRLVRKFDKLKRPVPDALVLSYVYQRERAAAEATREWTAGLLESVDAQGARVLLSVAAEGQPTYIWGPSDQPGGIADILATVRQPNFEQLVTASANGEAP